MFIPFGAKVLFWNNPDRADNTAGKLSPTSNEGVFLGYHTQPGFVWRGEYLVTKLEAIDYHLEHGSVVVQRTKRLELPSETHVFPLKAKADSLEPPPEPIADRVIPPVPDPIIPQQSDLEYTPSVAPEPIVPPAKEKEPPVDVELKKSSAEPLEPGEMMPDGSIVPDGYRYDGVRLVKTYKGSKRPRGILSELWKMMGPRQREKAIREEEH